MWQMHAQTKLLLTRSSKYCNHAQKHINLVIDVAGTRFAVHVMQ